MPSGGCPGSGSRTLTFGVRMARIKSRPSSLGCSSQSGRLPRAHDLRRSSQGNVLPVERVGSCDGDRCEHSRGSGGWALDRYEAAALGATSAQGVIDKLGGLSIGARQHVSVSRQSQGWRAMAEAFGHDLQVDASLQLERRVGVPEVVKT